jgi:molecular chaperone HtpG
MAKKNLSIHSENILPIIKKWLYSDKDIFLRELVSNSCDAIKKLKIIRDEQKLAIQDDEFRIDIKIDKDKKTIEIADTGIGMSYDEVQKYIAQIAFSGAEEFLKKYETNQEKDQIIGHFGLGFYSAYMVADQVELNTKSFIETEKGVNWKSDGNVDYTIEYHEKETRGTSILLHVNNDSDEYLEELKLKEILESYCRFLPYPIYLNGTQINHQDPLWLKNQIDCEDKDYLEFYHKLYPTDPDPVFWIHLNVDYPFNLKGILYFPKIHKKFDVNQSTINLFCNRVFVSDNCKDLFPDYLTVMRGAIDSPDIPLNVSRSYLQMDKTVKQVGSHISKKISDRLKSLFKTDKEKFINTYQEVDTIVKLAALQDEKFYERSKEFLLFKGIDNKWITVEEYLENNQEKIIYYTVDDKNSLIDLYIEKKIPVLIANSNLDAALINFLETKLSNAEFKRIDSDINSKLLDSSKDKSLLDTDGKSIAQKMSEYTKACINDEQLDVEAKSFASDKIIGMIQVDEKTRRLKEYMSMAQDASHFPVKKTFVINTNHKLVDAAWNLRIKKPELAKKIIYHLYNSALLSQKEIEPDKIKNYVSDNIDLIDALLS